ncbi:HAD-superfamily hydrolase, subfamily IA, variant 3 [Paenibacillus curdlanolyticus YK9]|uniref:HAD-superfamily hydrolase, subfamily IA, variant 3 n=1 Tax=Paenibacillus curdlanolyticus YK9 TaxID=717606 RepID=E0IDC3_9BACL|nr:pyrophosphatase PpaX [Paenibacillus curdlanolyticus]EFM09578.1 HAD-superfamily hydrolase, subfamily IA, variant 3 [Paenibacillus curdlanolyticus YK9]
MANQITTMLFDLDGTILDTNELIIQSFLHALEGIVDEGFGPQNIIPRMGIPLKDQLQHFSGLEDVAHLALRYREHNNRVHDEYVKLFPNVIEVLQTLVDRGIQVGVVTTKIRQTTDRGLAFVGLNDYVHSVVTIDDVTHAKPHPEPVLRALEELGADPARTMMIGDSVVDIEAAEAAGVISVGVAWSLKGEQKLRESGAQHIIHDMRDLYKFI